MAEQTAPPISAETLTEILAENSGSQNNMSLEALILLINMDRLRYLREKTHSEFSELKKRQDQVRLLHNLLKKINKATDGNGGMDCSANEELKQLLAQAKELGIEVKDGLAFNKEERDRLVENVRISVEDLNVMNDMQLQTINRLTNERYESYQLARAILKPLHDAKMQTARGIK